MRLHELSITAFGPFVDTVHVDFDELAAGGLFLLTGDTGAGKTSVLDAVCFALYGEVPGDRHTRPAPAQRPRRPAGRAAGRAAAQRRRAHLPVHPLPRLGPAQAARHRHHPGPGPRRRRGAARRRVDRADQPARRGRPARHRPARDDLHPVHPGGDAAPGPVPGVPARHARPSGTPCCSGCSAPRRFEEVERWLVERRVDCGGAARPATTGAPAWSTGSRRPPGSACPRSGTRTTSTRWPTTARCARWAPGADRSSPTSSAAALDDELAGRHRAARRSTGRACDAAARSPRPDRAASARTGRSTGSRRPRSSRRA